MRYIALLIAAIYLMGCKSEFEPITYGKDPCEHCKMTIVDKRFACELLTEKGKPYKFDDLGCLLQWLKQNSNAGKNARLFIANYAAPDDKFLDAYQAKYIHSETLHTPMNGNYAAFESNAAAQDVAAQLQSNILTWNDLK
ncbi:nitrous oxide reductase accessory protein NosL [Taibaiella soli]|uniref:Nitrous oxide reductase n=1 Tax=Taibaiella soli TaxID=1649169 RepID=A0A2W2AMK3_9BACT|nr:nitrous oxide reductase accessory protein NosL [Taibaiella soli]PZF74762.1 hypothetical protein DN068_00770 [Taibaiella soli]